MPATLTDLTQAATARKQNILAQQRISNRKKARHAELQAAWDEFIRAAGADDPDRLTAAASTLAVLLQQWGHDRYLADAAEQWHSLFEQQPDSDDLMQRLGLVELLQAAIGSNGDQETVRQHAAELASLAGLRVPGGLCESADNLREQIKLLDLDAQAKVKKQYEPAVPPQSAPPAEQVQQQAPAAVVQQKTTRKKRTGRSENYQQLTMAALIKWHEFDGDSITKWEPASWDDLAAIAGLPTKHKGRISESVKALLDPESTYDEAKRIYVSRSDRTARDIYVSQCNYQTKKLRDRLVELMDPPDPAIVRVDNNETDGDSIAGVPEPAVGERNGTDYSYEDLLLDRASSKVR